MTQRTHRIPWLGAPALWLALSTFSMGADAPKQFHLLDASIDSIHEAYKSGRLTARQLVQMYLNRIEAYDQKGPRINAVITINSKALEDADKLDAAYKKSGLVGPLHGIPVMIKDQLDAKGMPTTMGSLVFKNFYPDNDSFVVAKVRQAGGIIMGKATRGEMGGGDTHGSLFGSTRNPYDPTRTVGGSSGGPGAAVAANFATVAVGEEGFASIRRPATWNALAGMRPTAGLVSQTGMYNGWPQRTGALGPMARSVRDMAILLDVMVGYDRDNPITALGVGHIPASYTKFLDKNGLKGARIGVIRETMGAGSKPEAEDFKQISAVFDHALSEMKEAGAVMVDPIVIPDMEALLAKRAGAPGDGDESFERYMARNANPPYRTREDMLKSPDYSKIVSNGPGGGSRQVDPAAAAAAATERYHQFLVAREQLMLNLLKVMADNKLDAIVHKSVEHEPLTIEDSLKARAGGNSTGAPHINTFLVYVPSIAIPAGFSSPKLPTGITLLGRPYDEGTLLKLAYAYEQATHHRHPPESTPALPGEP